MAQQTLYLLSIHGMRASIRECLAPARHSRSWAKSWAEKDATRAVASEAGVRIAAMGDVMDAIGAVYDADALILTADDVGAGFIDLRTGLAGELFQKATQYAVRLALVLQDPAAHGPRWVDLAFEHRRHAAVRIVASRADAEAWLAP